MFDLSKTYGFNKKLAESGAKMQVGPDKDTDYVLVRRMPNDDYAAELQALMVANRKVLEFLEAQNPKEFRALDLKLQAQVMAKTVVVGWGPTFGEDGKAVPYSQEACEAFLLKYPDFRRDCQMFATDNKNYPLTVDAEAFEDVKKK